MRTLTRARRRRARRYYAGCNGPFFGSRGCGLGLATLPRDHWAGYQGGMVTTAPVRVTQDTLTVRHKDRGHNFN